MAQSALEQNPTSTLLTRALSMAPSVSVLTRFDCLDFQDLAGGGGGAVEASRPTTVVPSHFQLRSYGPEHVVHTYVLLRLLFVVVVVVVVFFLTPWFSYEQLNPEPESKLWHTSRFNVRV